MKRRMLVAAVAAIALVGFAAVALAEDDLGKRLRLVASEKCDSISIVFKRASCERMKIAALNAYGQRLLLQAQCAQSGTAACQNSLKEFDRVIEDGAK